MASVNHPYKYEPLSNLSDEIRLLRILPPKNIAEARTDIIQCELIHASLVSRGNPTYGALSYTWGNGGDGVRQVELNGACFFVGANLNDALRRFRSYSDPVVLWVDAVCINQSDIEERNIQIPRMHDIYSMADSVLVWLGSGDEETKKAIEFIHEAVSRNSPEYWTAFELDELWQKLVPVIKLFTKPYWERMWIVQEYLLSKCTLIYCGDDTITSSTLKEFQEQCMINNPALVKHVMPWARSEKYFTGLAALSQSGPIAIHQFADASQRNPTLYEVVSHLRRRKTSEPRDMIFAVVALLSETSHKEFPIDYRRSTTEVFTDFTVSCVQESRRLDCWAALAGKNSVLQDLPSWAVDWTVGSAEHAYLDNIMYAGLKPSHGNCNAAAGTFAEVRFREPGMLTFKGIALGSVDQVCPQSNLVFDSPDQEFLRAFAKWCDFVQESEIKATDAYISMARTLLIDFKKIINKPQWDDDKFHAGLVGIMANQIHKHGITSNNKSPEVFDKYKDLEPSFDPTEHEFISLALPYLMRYIMFDRRLFSTAKFSTLGVGPDDIQAGDILSVPLGCNFVMALRPQTDGTCKVVGPCYVDGFMQGEALQKQEEGALEMEYFTLR